MAHYIMSDIHGCYDLFISMLDKVHFSNNDVLVLLGDYIDRGDKSIEMIDWLMSHKHNDNMLFLLGNHEAEYIENINLINQINSDLPLADICNKIAQKTVYFDTYGTIRYMIENRGYDLVVLNKISEFFRAMPKVFKMQIGETHFIFSHAGYVQNDLSLEILLYDRGKTYSQKPIENTSIIHGHTPTLVGGELTFNHGLVHEYNDGSFNIFDIDCGCVFKSKKNHANLACLKIDDTGTINTLYV